MTKLFKIIIDIDQTIVDLLTPWLNEYNSRVEGDYFTPSDVAHYNPRNWGVREPRVLEDIICEPGWYLENVEAPVSVLETLERIYDCGHKLLIVSSWPSQHPGQIGEKVDWLHRNLPFLTESSFIFAQRKHNVVGDIFIDDCSEHIRRYYEVHPDKIIYAPGYRYNHDVRKLCRYMSPIDTPLTEFWDHVEAEIHNMAFDDSFRLNCSNCGDVYVSGAIHGHCPTCGGTNYAIYRK